MKDFGINGKNKICGQYESELDKVNKDLGYRAGQYTKQMIDPKCLVVISQSIYLTITSQIHRSNAI